MKRRIQREVKRKREIERKRVKDRQKALLSTFFRLLVVFPYAPARMRVQPRIGSLRGNNAC